MTDTYNISFLMVYVFQVYKVQVHIGKDTWFVFRRYAEFDKLYNSVRRLICNCSKNELQICFKNCLNNDLLCHIT